MQDFLTKHGLAAHLALAAVAPLFLFSFCSAAESASVVLALSLFAAVWMLLAPTRLKGEVTSFESRARVLASIVRDPLFWALLLIVLYAAVAWLNTGVSMAYNAEEGVWYRAEAAAPLFPASVEGLGSLPAAGAVALLVTVTGARHALGRSSRAALLHWISVFSGIAALFNLVLFYAGNVGAAKAVDCAWSQTSYAGTGFGLAFLAGLTSLELEFEASQRKRLFWNAFSVGACAAGLLFFMPLEIALMFLLAGVLLIMLSSIRLAMACSANDAFKYLSLLALASLVPVLCVVGLASDNLLAARGALFSREGGLFPENWLEIRATLDRIAHSTWQEVPWLGTGVGSFSLDLRFAAEPADWAILPGSQETTLNGWWQLLAESGIVGLLLTLLVPGFLLFTWVRRLIAFFPGRKVAVLAAVLGILALVLVWAEAFVTTSILRPEVAVLACTFLAVAGKSFPVLQKPAAEAEETKK